MGTSITLPSGTKPVVLTAQTLLKDNWVASGDYFQYTFVSGDITPQSIVTFTPNNQSVLEVSVSQMLPLIETNAGSCIIYSYFPPLQDIVGNFVIQ